jgi:hypothetical protein
VVGATPTTSVIGPSEFEIRDNKKTRPNGCTGTGRASDLDAPGKRITGKIDREQYPASSIKRM